MNGDLERIVDELRVEKGSEMPEDNILVSLELFLALDEGIGKALENSQDLDLNLEHHREKIVSRAIENIISSWSD